MPSTAQQLFSERDEHNRTNRLARKLASLSGWDAPEGYDFAGDGEDRRSGRARGFYFTAQAALDFVREEQKA